ncbi:MAG: peptidoglycan-associated lipoprotein, partial [Acetobacteraceae bacterium]|nr:peptidoglycan-associated lipoprotein [Acetobacteraceae bacterium]
MWKTLLSGLLALSLLTACSKSDDVANTSSAGGGAATPGSQADLAQTAGDRVFFELAASTLSPAARTTLDKQAAWLAKYPKVQVQMAGNCDERGTTEYNLALGQRRASAARDYLVARGVNSGRLSVISYG